MTEKTKRTPALAFTKEKMEDAVKGHYYIKLGDTRGKLQLSGAARMWAKDPEIVYVSELRVAGRPEDIIEKVVASEEYDEKAVRRLLRDAYKAGSEESEAFKAEVEAARSHAKKPGVKKAKAATYVPLHTASWYAENLEDAVIVNKDGSPSARKRGTKKAASPSTKAKKPAAKGAKKAAKGAKKAATKATGTRTKKSLAERLAALSEGKVLDVSKYTKAEGFKAVSAKEPGPNSAKIAVPGYAVVSSELRALKTALKEMELDVDTLAAAWSEAKKAAAKKPRTTSPKSKKASPKSRSASPKKVASPSRAPSGGRAPEVDLPTYAAGKSASGSSSGVASKLPSLSASSPRSARSSSPRA